MTPTLINSFISGGVAVAFFMIGVSFFRFWQSSRIQLFRLFSIAFFLLTIERVVLLLVRTDDESAFYIYMIRLAAFCVIIAGIIVQNRKGGSA